MRFARSHLVRLFPCVPGQSGYNKRLRRAGVQLRAIIRVLSIETESWFDDTWLVGSTPVERGRPTDTAKRSDLAGYGYCASYSRYFWGLRLHLVAIPAGLPVTFALTSPKDDEHRVLRDLLEYEASLLGGRPGQVILADKDYRSAEFEAFLAQHGATLVCPAMKREAPRPGARLLKPLRRIIESVNDTLKGQLDLERHGERTLGRRPHPNPSAALGTHCGDLAQRSAGEAAGPLAPRLRPLTPWNLII